MSSTVTCNKSCSYRDCGNTTRNIPVGSDITFFGFPQNPERLFKWKILCGLPPDSNPKFICSKHFDHRKYVSCNSRRKTLIQTAVPYAYNLESSILMNEYQEYELVEIENDNLQFDDKNQQYQAIINDALETDSNDCTEIQEKRTESIIELTPIKVTKLKKNSTISNAAQNNKRTPEISLNQMQNSEVPTKKIKIKNETDKIIEVNTYDISVDPESILKQDEINTFIFKNEEYIQMPKRMFMEHHNVLVEQIQSKKSLLAEMQYYKNQLTKIKNIIDI